MLIYFQLAFTLTLLVPHGVCAKQVVLEWKMSWFFREQSQCRHGKCVCEKP